MNEWRNPAAGNGPGWGPRLPHPITVVFTTDPEAPWIAFPLPHGTLPAERREEGFWKQWIQSLGAEGPPVGIGVCPQDAVASLLYAVTGEGGPKLLTPPIAERALAEAFRRVLVGDYLKSDLVPDPENPDKLRADFGSSTIEDGNIVVLTGPDRISVMQALKVDKEADQIAWNVLMTVLTEPTEEVEEAPKPAKKKAPAKKKPAKKAAAKKKTGLEVVK